MNHTIEIASLPDREQVVAELWFGDEQWAEINQESSKLQIEIFARANGEPWSFDYHEAMDALRRAVMRLTGDAS